MENWKEEYLNKFDGHHCPDHDQIDLTAQEIAFISSLLTEQRQRMAKEIEGNKKEESVIPDCDNCGAEGYHKAWYGHGKPTHDTYGDKYYPTGSVILCQDCKKTIREWDGENIWRWTSELPEHNERRINEITKVLKEHIGFNSGLQAALNIVLGEGEKQ